MAFSHSVVTADWAKAAVQAEQMRTFAAGLGPRAEPRGRRYAQAMAHFAPFQVAYFCGRLAEAEGHLLRWLACHEGEDFDQRLTTTPMLCNGSILAGLMGRADVARRWGDQAAAWATATGVVYEQVFADALRALLHLSLGEDAAAESLGLAAAKTAGDMGVQHTAGWARVAAGSVCARRGSPGEGARQIQTAIADLIASGNLVSLPQFLNLLAEAQMLDGAFDDALASLSEALVVAPLARTERPHSLILRGELRARTGQPDAADADFREAIAEAPTTGALAYELRAATGLARGLTARGQPAAARGLLVPLLEAVAAGGESATVANARSLVADLVA